MKIAVTGSCGFIGSHLVKRLEESGMEIIEIDIKKGIDISEEKQLHSVERFDLLYHLAAKSYVPDSYKYPLSFYHCNIIGTLNALELCRIYKAGMVYVSSYIYGQPQYMPIDEKHPVSAFNPYSQSKIFAEQLCAAYNRDFGLPVMVIRPFNIYGQGQNENFLIPTIMKQIKTGRVILKDSRPRRDFLYIDDLADLLVKAGQYDKTNFEIFNAGSGKSFSVKQVVGIICSLAGGDIDVKYENQQRTSEVMDTIADISKAQKLLQWKPKVPLQQGLQKMICGK